MESISTKYNLNLNKLEKVKLRIHSIINRCGLNIDTLQKLNIQLDGLFGLFNC